MLRDWHKGRCAVCGEEKRIVRDHDHNSFLMRGWLCVPCNCAEGVQKGVFELYRERYPALILGISIRYDHAVYGQA